MKKNFLLIFGVIFLIVILERALSGYGLFYDLEFATYDWRARLATDKGPFNSRFKHADKDIAMISIDDYSMNKIAENPQLKLSSWPWRRDTWASVVDFIEKGNPKMIIFDIYFANLNENPSNDIKFANTLKKYNNVIIATTLSDSKNFLKNQPKKTRGSADSTNGYLPAPKSLNVEFKDNSVNEDAITYYSNLPIHNMYTKYNTVGVVNIIAGKDYVIRKTQPIFKLIKNGKTYYIPSLSFAGFLKHIGEGDKITIKNNEIQYKDRIIPIDKNGRTDISWHGKGFDYAYKSGSFIPIADVLLSQNNGKYIKSNYFKDKIVIIGMTQTGTDIHPTAVKRAYAGPEVNATAIDNFINDTNPDNKKARKIVTKMPSSYAFALILASCLVLAFLGIISTNALMCFISSFSFIMLYITAATWMFADPAIRIWVPMVIPLYYMIASAIIIFMYRFQKEKAEKESITSAFGKFVSPKVLSNLLKNHENLTLQSTKKRITVMFCDVKDFTSLSEKYDPKELMDDLNELFETIVSVIFENNGTVDKFIGDSIMAYWGDPLASDDDAFMAIKAALEIKKSVNDLKIENARENKIILDVKIGINTGEALLGLAGSEKIMSYTAMGDAVNVASRLEAACSKLKRDILISQATYEDVQSKIKAVDAGTIKVKGRDEHISVFEPIEVIKRKGKNSEK